MAVPPGGDTHSAVAAAVRRAADALADAGYDVAEAVPPDYEAALDAWGRFLLADIQAQGELLRAVMGPGGVRFHDLTKPMCPPADAAAGFAVVVERRRIHRAWSAFLAERPLILSPIWTQPPFRHGWTSRARRARSA